jgi:hypothetical protein
VIQRFNALTLQHFNVPGKVELLRWRRIVLFLQIAGVAELADALHQKSMITTGKDAVVAISLPIQQVFPAPGITIELPMTGRR